MKLPQTGGCQCGALRYEIIQEPQMVCRRGGPVRHPNTTYWGSCSLRQVVPRVFTSLSCYGVLLLARLAGSAHHSAKFRNEASPVVLTSRHYAGDQEIEQRGLDRYRHLQDTALVRPNKTRVAHHIDGKDRDEAAGLAHVSSPMAKRRPDR